MVPLETLKVKVLVDPSCPTLCDPMDCSLPVPLTLLVGMQTSTATMENSVEIP